MKNVTLNHDQGLYCIRESYGYSCLGFDVCIERATKYAQEIGAPLPALERGALTTYEFCADLEEKMRLINAHTGIRFNSGLTPELIGKEGKRVEVVDSRNEKRRFIVGKSTGWIPCHLEILTRSSTGGFAVTGAPFKSVRVVG